MAKPPRKESSRKPPTPTDDHAAVEEQIGRAMPDLQPILRYLDQRIRATHKGLRYAVKWKRAHYGLPKLGWIIQLAPYDVSVNLVFYGGATFDKPPPDGEGSRYVKLRTLEEAKAPEIHDWIEQAGRVPGWAWDE